MHDHSDSKTTGALIAEARAYYRLCDEGDALGIPTSLDDPRSPKTVPALRAAVAAAKQEDDRR